MFYVYTLNDPRDGKVFYVGKGKGDRATHHEGEARRGKRSRKCDRIREIWEAGLQVDRRIVERFSDEDDAFEREISLIASIGLANLTNVLPGGQGKAQPGAMTPEQIKARYKEYRLRGRVDALARKFYASAVFPREARGAEMGRVFVSALGSLIGTNESLPWKPTEYEPYKALGVQLEGPSPIDVLLEIAADPKVERGNRMDAIVSLAPYCKPFGAANGSPKRLHPGDSQQHLRAHR